jgi:ABC-type nitrate/sulfonate/bicarbonate transport system substrate-binding protein
MRGLYRLAAASFAAIFAWDAGPNASAAEPTTVQFGVDTRNNINGLTLAIADREGFFAREGLTLEQTQFLATRDRDRNRASLLAALKKGDVNFTRVQTPFLLGDEGRRAGIVAIAGVVENPVYFLVAKPSIETFADLKGKSVTEPRFGDIISMTARELITEHGLKLSDVTIKDIPDSSNRVDCLLSGQCDAGTVDQPAVFKLFDAGFHTLALHSEAGPPLLYVVDVVDRDWAMAHRDTVVKYVRASAEAMRFIHDPKNRDEVVKVAMGVTGQPEDRARQMLDYYWDPKYRVLPENAEIDMNALAATIDLVAKFGFVKEPVPKAGTLVDLSFAQAAGVR